MCSTKAQHINRSLTAALAKVAPLHLMPSNQFILIVDKAIYRDARTKRKHINKKKNQYAEII
jgi:hypothetical protein